jgi:hypothetical protein
MKRSHWRAARDRLHTPETTAYHEAGHVVVAYEFGWWVRRGGVRIGAWAHARLQHRKSDYTMLADICIHMAGLLAEQKFLGLQWHFEEAVIEHLRAVRAGKDEGLRLYPTDTRAIALALLEDDPTICLSGARGVVAYCQNQTNALLDEPRVWGGVERLAKVLYRRRYLSPRAVKKVLGDAFFADAGRMIRDSHGHRLAEASPRATAPKRTTSGAEVQQWRLCGL